MTMTRTEFLRLLGAGAVTAALPRSGVAWDPTMRMRPIPTTGEPLPVVGIGTWRTFDVPAQGPEMEDLRAVLRILFRAGGSVIDTSPMYDPAEDRIGTLLADMGARHNAFIATKVWTRGRRSGIEQMQRSMDAMGVDVVDLMQVHNLVDLPAHLPTLRAWKEEGRIRYWGVTHYTDHALDDLARVIRDEGPDFVQLAYSVDAPAAAERVLPLAAERGVAIIANRPFGGGSMFRAVRGHEVPAWAAQFADSWAQVFLKWILGHPAVTCTIPGTGNPKHARDNMGAGFGRLPDEGERRRIQALIQDL